MPFFFKNKDVGFDFRVCRAHLTSKEVQQEHGIWANFSVKLFLVNFAKDGTVKNETALASINNLTLVQSREDVPFIGSKHEIPRIAIRGEDGSIKGYKELAPVYNFGLYPGSNRGDDEELAKLHDTFIDQLIEEIGAFYKEAQERKAAPVARERHVPPALQRLRDMKIKTTDGGETNGNGDVPF